jgi:ArsR family metal-binding transcriptional regulator
MALAVIELESDISTVLPVLDRAIPGSTYNREFPQLVFNMKGWIVTVNPQSILIYTVENEAEAHAIMKWLQNIVDHPDKTELK